MNIPRKRSGSNSKKTKEKYELLFRNEESDEINENLLNEIINSNIVCENFEIEVMKIVNIDQSSVVRKNLNLLIKECIKSLDTGKIVGNIVEVQTGRLMNISRQLEEDCKQLKDPWCAVLLYDEKIQRILADCFTR